MTQSIRQICNSMSKKEKKEKYSRPKEKNPNWKGGVSTKKCKCGKEIKTKNKTCIKCINRNGGNNSFFGKNHSEKTKQILKNHRLGTYNGNQNKPIIIDKIEYRSAGEASKILKIPMVTIRWRVMSKNKKFNNYKYKT